MRGGSHGACREGVEERRALEDHPNLKHLVGVVGVRDEAPPRNPFHEDLPRVRCQKACKKPQRGRLARARSADYPHSLSSADLEGATTQNFLTAKSFVYISQF
eukprot:CAMPEP_0177582222 /NCGR_PEP_ID=MMETSP0419_2-20121207/2609_1 /TAXON_ID=582737 /ORGANISM="Tetraselmis sp., Strain GSL018" /LENGTH=102 /DNA_ID=CAMNT_0019071403 /DNA_START=471 /DNA_END=779 /DNA_ORIENTATION=-